MILWLLLTFYGWLWNVPRDVPIPSHERQGLLGVGLFIDALSVWIAWMSTRKS